MTRESRMLTAVTPSRYGIPLSCKPRRYPFLVKNHFYLFHSMFYHGYPAEGIFYQGLEASTFIHWLSQ